jgi:hypothetical protein
MIWRAASQSALFRKTSRRFPIAVNNFGRDGWRQILSGYQHTKADIKHFALKEIYPDEKDDHCVALKPDASRRNLCRQRRKFDPGKWNGRHYGRRHLALANVPPPANEKTDANSVNQ